MSLLPSVGPCVFWSALKIFFPCTGKSFPPHSRKLRPSFDLHLKCNGKGTTSATPFCWPVVAARRQRNIFFQEYFADSKILHWEVTDST